MYFWCLQFPPKNERKQVVFWRKRLLEKIISTFSDLYLLRFCHCVSLVRDFALFSIFSAERGDFHVLQDFLFVIGTWIWAVENLRSSHHASVVRGYRHVWLCFCSCRPNHNSEKNMNVIFEVPNIQAQQYEKWLKAMHQLSQLFDRQFDQFLSNISSKRQVVFIDFEKN